MEGVDTKTWNKIRRIDWKNTKEAINREEKKTLTSFYSMKMSEKTLVFMLLKNQSAYIQWIIME